MSFLFFFFSVHRLKIIPVGLSEGVSIDCQGNQA